MCNRDLLVGGASNDGAFRGVSSADSDLGAKYAATFCSFAKLLDSMM